MVQLPNLLRGVQQGYCVAWLAANQAAVCSFVRCGPLMAAEQQPWSCAHFIQFVCTWPQAKKDTKKKRKASEAAGSGSAAGKNEGWEGEAPWRPFDR